MEASDTRTFTKVEQYIRAMTDAYLELGVCVVEDGWSKAYYGNNQDRETALTEYLAITSSTFVVSYMRVVAKELKRPFVVAELYHEYIELKIPRKKFLEPLFASFLLGPEVKEYGRAQMASVPMYYRGTPTLVRVTFNGDDGKSIYDMFIERCRTDDDYKKALRTC